jgi:AraC-like DNA-binding protein
MIDPLSEIIALLRPRTVFSKGISGAGKWGVRYGDFGHPSFCIVLEGSCLLAVEGEKPLALEEGDFVLLPTTPGFTLSGFEQVTPNFIDPHEAPDAAGPVRHGPVDEPASVRLLGGYFLFDAGNADLLVPLLPRLVHIRQAERLSVLVRLLAGEAEEQRPGRDLVLGRLIEILLVEALRETQGRHAPAGLLRGLGDARLSEAIRLMHGDPGHPWTVDRLAKEAALSRSTFYARFAANVGMPPMEYLIGWRMALAKDLLRKGSAIAEIAERVGYGSASAFSTAFRKSVGQPPRAYSRMQEQQVPV